MVMELDDCISHFACFFFFFFPPSLLYSIISHATCISTEIKHIRHGVKSSRKKDTPFYTSNPYPTSSISSSSHWITARYGHHHQHGHPPHPLHPPLLLLLLLCTGSQPSTNKESPQHITYYVSNFLYTTRERKSGRAFCIKHVMSLIVHLTRDMPTIVL